MLSGGQQVCDVLEKEPTCIACALGALFVGAVMKADALKVSDVQDTDWNSHRVKVNLSSLFEYLREYFDDEQRSLIESAFEGNVHGDDGHRSMGFRTLVLGTGHGQRRKAESADKKVMGAIMKNIIRNKGNFVPPARANREE
jgi:hypothetical protein